VGVCGVTGSCVRGSCPVVEGEGAGRELQGYRRLGQGVRMQHVIVPEYVAQGGGAGARERRGGDSAVGATRDQLEEKGRELPGV